MTSRTLGHSPAMTPRVVLENIAQKLKFSRPDDWYSMTKKDVIANGGGAVLRASGDSISKLVQAAFPEHPWLPWKFAHLPKHFWRDMQNQRMYWKWLQHELQLKSMDEWYSVSIEMISANHGRTLLMNHYDGRLNKALTAAFPDHNWDQARFNTRTMNLLSSTDSRKLVLANAMSVLGLNSLDGWYNVTTADFFGSHKQARNLLDKYRGSISHALLDLFPDHDWEPWRFKKLPHGFWQGLPADRQTATLHRYVGEFLGESVFGIKDLSDWYRVSTSQLRQAGALDALDLFGGLPTTLSTLYPNHVWDRAKFASKSKKTSQLVLKKRVEELFPGRSLVEEFLPTNPGRATLRSSSTFDIVVPDLNIVFEYQGAHHYRDVMKYGDHAQKLVSESSKAAFCTKEGYTLISVPYWWDTSLESLANTVHAVRPDLIPNPIATGASIPLQPPA